MTKHIKLIFYITSAVVLGLFTIWEIYTVREVLIAGGGKQLDAEISQVQHVIQIWEKRHPFTVESFDRFATPSAEPATRTPDVTGKKASASPSATAVPEN